MTFCSCRPTRTSLACTSKVTKASAIINPQYHHTPPKQRQSKPHYFHISKTITRKEKKNSPTQCGTILRGQFPAHEHDDLVQLAIALLDVVAQTLGRSRYGAGNVARPIELRYAEYRLARPVQYPLASWFSGVGVFSPTDLRIKV